MSAELATETGILVLLRGAMFFGCRKYLLRSLYSDLQDLSGAENPLNSIPMRDPLPSPITQVEKAKPNRKTESVYSTLSSDIFAGCFSESCLLFLLLMLQGMNVFSSSTRLFNWRLSMFLLLACILVLVPFVITLLLTVGPDPGLSVVHAHGLSCPGSSSAREPYSSTSSRSLASPSPAALSVTDRMTALLSRLVVLGTVVLGLLAGYGAVSSSWAFIPSKNAVIMPTEQDIVSAEYALSSIRDDLERKRAEAARRAAAQQADGTWLSRVMPSFRGDENLQELKGLEALEYQMGRSLDDLRKRRAAAKFANTFRGRLVNVGGRFFAMYCVFRYMSCIVNIFFPLKAAPPPSSSSSTTSYPDIVTKAIAELLDKVWPGIEFDDVARTTRHLSLVLVGVIILSSIRLVLRGVTRALRVTSRSLGASLMLLLLAQLMAIYLLSTIVQLRSSFPPPPSSSLPSSPSSTDDPSPAPTNLFTTIPEFQVFGSLFDWAFFMSATGSFAVRWVANKVNGPKEY
ncbi:G protein-coupled receptor 89 [Mycena sanguinolenta]|uniref:G protein-coupled receptor 89 n=1 Tax=Mycena sanguinolenta TaxID=230812 RepID=A0A8H6ZCJ4_9AGAR|nr:G protein-coupled receptor 89 [Mycena sanguinolenta]